MPFTCQSAFLTSAISESRPERPPGFSPGAESAERTKALGWRERARCSEGSALQERGNRPPASAAPSGPALDRGSCAIPQTQGLRPWAKSGSPLGFTNLSHAKHGEPCGLFSVAQAACLCVSPASRWREIAGADARNTHSRGRLCYSRLKLARPGDEIFGLHGF